MRRTRLVPTFLLGLLVAGAACDADRTLTEPTPPPANAGLIGGLLGTITGILGLLSCNPLPSAYNSATIGPAGGTLKFGPHQLMIPPGALSSSVKITGEVVNGSVNSVRFSPEGLHFALPAGLTMSYSNCASKSNLKVVFTSETLKVLEVLPSTTNTSNRTVSGLLEHFSRYAVAY